VVVLGRWSHQPHHVQINQPGGKSGDVAGCGFFAIEYRGPSQSMSASATRPHATSWIVSRLFVVVRSVVSNITKLPRSYCGSHCIVSPRPASRRRPSACCTHQARVLYDTRHAVRWFSAAAPRTPDQNPLAPAQKSPGVPVFLTPALRRVSPRLILNS
jgi:hypothetical protein